VEQRYIKYLTFIPLLLPLLSGDIRFMRMFAGVPLGSGHWASPSSDSGAVKSGNFQHFR